MFNSSAYAVIPRAQTKQSVERPSTSLFQWADSTENFRPSSPMTAEYSSSTKDAHMFSDEKSRSSLSLDKTPNSSIGDSRSLGQSQVQNHNLLSMATVNPLEMMQSNKNRMAIPDFSGIEFGSSEPNRSEKHTSSPSESGSSRTSFPAGAFGSNSSFSVNISEVKISAVESHPVQTVSLTSVQSSSSLSSSPYISTTSSSTKPSLPASSLAIPSSKWDISQANADATQKPSEPKALASSFTFPSTLSFPTSKDGIISSNAMNEISTSPESASQSNVSLFGSKRNENPMTQSTISNTSLGLGSNLKTVTSASQPELPSAASDLKPGQTMPLTSTTELAASLISDNQINAGRISSPAVDLTSNDKSEKPSVFQFNPVAAVQTPEMSNDGKMGSLDEVTHEDEMEEEVPESGLVTELSLGNLGGFGIGSAPDSSTGKPNPFGLGVSNNATTLSISPFIPPAPTGELFRPASFNFQPQPSQPANAGAFSSGFGTGSTNQVPTAAGFGQPTQFGPGQQVLESVLGSFGQSRQIGTGLPASGIASPSGFAGGFSGASSSGGFSSLASSGPVGFAGAATGAGGFAAAATAGAGFAGAAIGYGGFAGAATGAGGFAGAGFTG